MSLRPIVAFFALLLLLESARAADEPNQPLRLLTVGNSFAVNATTFLPDLAASGGHRIVVVNAYKGGCSLEEHADALGAAIADPASPAGKIYASRFALDGPGNSGDTFSLPEALQQVKWDYVTIQQASRLSDDADSYEPYASEILAAIHRYAPQAEVLVHETWAWRVDEPRFSGGGDTPEKMCQGLRAAYAKLSAEHRLRLLPVGDAFQAALATPRWRFVPDAAFDFAHPADGLLPKESGGLNMGWAWKRNPVTGLSELAYDGRHADVAGQYLAAAVFYEVLLAADVRQAPFCPPGLSPKDAADLRRIAHETVHPGTS